MPTPDDGETYDEFLDRCIEQVLADGTADDEDQATAICESIWSDTMDERQAKTVIHKTHASAADGLDFVLSDTTPDRYGDVIMADGWLLENFNKNPIALFNHNSNFPVGKWRDLRIDGEALIGRLELAPAGTSERIDEIRKLVEAGILKAVSVGFVPVESKARSKTEPGELYVKSELVETSLVSVPANPNALAIAKSLKVSDDTLKLVFAKHGDERRGSERRAALNGKNAETPALRKTKIMSPIAQRIKDTEARIVKLKDDLTAHMAKVDDENPDDAATATTEELTGKIEAQEKSLAALKRAEANLAANAAAAAEENGGESGLTIRNARPFAVPAKKLAPVDYLFRALTVQIKHHAEKGRRTMLDVLKETYGEDEATRVLMNVVTKVAAAPALTTSVGWAAELVTTAIGEFFGLLQPVSIYAGLAARGGRFTFGRNGVVAMPTRLGTSSINGSFVAQGAAIPVRQGAFSSVSMTPKKMAVISTFSREISEHSTPAIEQLIRQAIIEDTAVAIDTVLLDAAAATAIRPAGLLNGVAKTPAVAGGGITSLIGDIKALTTALITATSGNTRAPTWIMSPADALAISLTQAAAGGDLPFRDEIGRGQLVGYPVIQSTSMTADTMFLVDAADFVTATGDEPRFDVSDQATLHMDDAAGQIGVGGAIGAGETRSLWQSDSIGIRMILDMNWAMRRTGMVVWTDTMLWN